MQFLYYCPVVYATGLFSEVFMNRKIELKKITVIGMLCAVAYLCMFMFKFKVSFLTFDFKDAFLAIISFLYGPIYSSISAILVAFLEFLSVSDTGIYGFIMNALSSVAFAAACGLLYKYKHTFGGAVTGATVAVFLMTAVMLLANWIITPFYMGVERSQVVAMIPTLLLPFNLIKGIVNMAITLIIYKPITTVFKKTGLINTSSNNTTDKKRFLIITVISVVLIIASVLVIFYVFDGTFELVKK